MFVGMTKNDRRRIRAIAARAARKFGEKLQDEQTIFYDVAACHLNGCPLDLEKLVKASEETLLHDLVGINRNICRETGELKNHFLPRCAK